MKGIVLALAALAVIVLGGVFADDAAAQCNVSRSVSSVSNSAQILEQAALTQALQSLSQQRAVQTAPTAVATVTRSAVVPPAPVPAATAIVSRSAEVSSGCDSGGRSRSVARSSGRLRPRASSSAATTVSVTRTRTRASARG